MDQHVADRAIKELKEKRSLYASQLEALMGVEFDTAQLKTDLYNAFIGFHRAQNPQIPISRIHEYFLKERNAMARKAIIDAVKDELWCALGHPLSKYWNQVNLEMAIDIYYYEPSLHQYILPDKKREKSPVIKMRDITKQMESMLNIQATEELRNEDGTIRRVVNDNFRTVFTVKNLNDAPEGSDKLLEDLIDYFIARADKETESKAEKCSIIIRSAVLEKPIQIPYRGLAQNTPYVVMEQFDAVDHSGKRMGRPSLYSQPIHIEIVMGPSHDEALVLIRKGQGGSGRRGREILHGIDVNNLIPVKNEDLDEFAKNHCLLLAVQLTWLYVNMNKTRLANVHFQNLVHGNGARAKCYRTILIKEMLTQMKRHGIRYPPRLRHYNVEEHIPMIQRLLNLRFPGQYRLSVFGEHGQMRPLWKGPERAKKEISLYLKDDHFYGIRKINSLFGTSYCLDCEIPYYNKMDHRQNCAAKCPRCCGMGANFPCKEIKGYELHCSECANIFRNPICYKRHIDRRVCRLFKRCTECGKIYRVKKTCNNNEDSESNSNIDGHLCFVRFCSLCRSWHKREEKCYVQPIIPRRAIKNYLMIVFDFECELLSPIYNIEDWKDLESAGLTPSRAIPIDENYQLHHVNCVSAMLFCARCMQEEQWKEDETGSCKFCGPGLKRMRSWTADTCNNPLREFLEWLIVGLGRERTGRTYAISHYGGRYDMHLLLGELIKHFGIEPNITRTGNKLYEVLVKKQRGICPYISFRDSFNWMMLKLEQLPKALGLEIDEGGKSFFPHGWNYTKNMKIRLKGLPDCQFYYPESMTKQRRKEFD
uniref:DNA-directed DNA polymerase n=1 Tax=Meloidogyne hapla TaxID=6305 RepID=A0A1I8B7B9_MELHA